MPKYQGPIKPALTFEQQIELLKSRGLIIEDNAFAAHVLQLISYYRFSGYSLSLRKNDTFYQGVTFNSIYNIYQFDRKLRHLIFNLIERLEISFRTTLAYYLAHTYDPFCYEDAAFFENPNYHVTFINELHKLIEKNAPKELFIKHYKEKYGGVFPIWVVMEVFSFGMLSKLFRNMLSKDRGIVAKQYCGFPARYLVNWLHSLSNVRNICAHYGRLYNRKLTVNLLLSNRQKYFCINPSSMFASMSVLKYVIKDEKVWTTFVTNLCTLVEEYNNVDISFLGFPNNWEEVLRKI